MWRRDNADHYTSPEDLGGASARATGKLSLIRKMSLPVLVFFMRPWSQYPLGTKRSLRASAHDLRLEFRGRPICSEQGSSREMWRRVAESPLRYNQPASR
jgi:hypothetical protein